MRIEIVGYFDVNTINSAITSTIRQLLRVTLQKTWELQQYGYRTQILRNVILNMNFNSFYNQTIIKGMQSPENQNLLLQEKEENSVLFHII